MLKLKNKLNLKSLTLGITLGIVVSSFIPVFASMQEYLLTKITYPILINGQEYINEELPMLNWEGNTFIPLRTVGDILDVEVKWNQELKRVEIGEVNEVFMDNKEVIENELISYPNESKIYLRINDNGLYDNSNFLLARKNNEIYSNSSGLNVLLNILSNNYDIISSKNPLLKGTISINQNQTYAIDVKSEYTDINNDRKTYEIYNVSEPTRRYTIPTDVAKNGSTFINVSKILNFFNYPKDAFILEINEQDKSIIININTL